MAEPKQAIAILGATGSIGRQTLEVIEQYPELFEVVVLTANNNWELLAQQAIKFSADTVVIANEQHHEKLSCALEQYPIKVYSGTDSLKQVVCYQTVHCVVSALVGYAGLMPTIAAIESGKKIALANKEVLVVAGQQIMELAKRYNATIIPVDSEHSAIFQSLVGECCPIEKIILTASGGPFYGYNTEQLKKVTLEEALRNPNWSMGKKVTIDSATMMNKGLEVIEAKWLFGTALCDIDVFVHRSSIVHSMVQFADGAVKAQLGSPNMKQPIQYALTYPVRLPLENPRLNFSGMNLEFLPVDKDNFMSLQLAYNAAEQGGNMPCIMNAANEVAVEAFLKEKIAFLDIPKYTQKAMAQIDFIRTASIDDYIKTDMETRKFISKLI